MTVHHPIAAAGCGCDAQDIKAPLIAIDEALARIAAHVDPIGRSEAVTLEASLGRVLTQPVRARSMIPAFDNAAMDGYALASATLTGPGPWALDVVARVPAGSKAGGPLSAGQAARIFTGAPIPQGADAVVMQENTLRDGGRIHLDRPIPAGLNIRRAGSEMAARAVVLAAGQRMGVREIAATAAAGVGIVRVRRKVRAALLVTGNEVQKAGATCEAAQIWDVNTPMLTAALTVAGVEIIATAHGADDRAALARQMAEMASRADLILTTGGISVGEEDHVKPAFADIGGETIFSGVAIKPGKPVSFGQVGTAFWLGLPGNPQSAFVTWQVFGAALLRALGGESDLPPARRHVVTSAPIHHKPGRCELRPATLDGFDALGREVVRFEEATHSARVGRLPHADGLIFLPADAGTLPKGALVEFQPFRDG